MYTHCTAGERTTPPATRYSSSSFFTCSSGTHGLALCSLIGTMRCRRRPRLGMGWLRSALSPLRRLWCRVNELQRKKRGIYILYDDVKSCQCEDVHVLWSILVESHGLPPQPGLSFKQ